MGTIVPSGTKYASANCVLGWRKSEVVEFSIEPEKLPKEWQKVKIEADKKAVKKELKAGVEFDFAVIVNKNNIQIK